MKINVNFIPLPCLFKIINEYVGGWELRVINADPSKPHFSHFPVSYLYKHTWLESSTMSRTAHLTRKRKLTNYFQLLLVTFKMKTCQVPVENNLESVERFAAFRLVKSTFKAIVFNHQINIFFFKVGSKYHFSIVDLISLRLETTELFSSWMLKTEDEMVKCETFTTFFTRTFFTLRIYPKRVGYSFLCAWWWRASRIASHFTHHHRLRLYQVLSPCASFFCFLFLFLFWCTPMVFCRNFVVSTGKILLSFLLLLETMIMISLMSIL